MNNVNGKENIFEKGVFVLDNEFDFDNFDVPVYIGPSVVALNLLTNVLGKREKKTQFEEYFNYNYLKGFDRKYEEWKKVLKGDLITKANYDQKRAKSILSSSFVDLYFNKHLKKIYYFYFIMGFSRGTEMEGKIVKELKQPIDDVFVELFHLTKKNTPDGQQGAIYGPISIGFAEDAYRDGISYSLYIDFERLQDSE